MRLIFVISFMFLWTLNYGQPSEVEQEVLNGLSGEAYFSEANDLALNYLDAKPSTSQQLLDEIFSRQELNNYPKQLGQAYYIQARAYYLQGQYDRSYEPFDKALAIFQELNDQHSIAKCHLGKGMSYTYQGQKKEAKEALNRSLDIFTEIDNDKGLGETFHELGHYYYIFAQDSMALEYYRKGLSIQERLDDQKGISNSYFRMALAYLSSDKGEALSLLDQSKRLKDEINDLRGATKVGISLGVMHEENGNFNTALDYYKESLEANKDFGDKRIDAILFNNIGIVYLDLGMLDSAIISHQRALNLRRELGNDRGVVQSLSNIGEAYQKKEDFQNSIAYFLEAKTISASNEREPLMPFIGEKLGELHLSLQNLDSANFYLQNTLNLKKKEGNYFGLSSTYRNLSALSEKQNKYQESLEYFKLYKTVQDSAFKASKNRELAEVQAKYDTAKKEKEIGQLQEQNRSQRLWQNIYAVGALLALIATGFIFQFFRYRSRKNQELLEIKESQRQQLEEVNKLKTRFFNNISHEFRTPLTLILGPLEKLKATVDSNVQPTVSMIERNGKRLLKLINQLLDLSKIEDGKVSLKASYVDILPLLKGWGNSFHSLAEMNNIDFSMDFSEDQYYLYADQAKLEEVVINLLSNAIKYTPAGGKVTLEVESAEKDQNGYLQIKVSDTGSGIPKEELESIFDRFYQASNTNINDAVGTGIGLALVKELIELHKGFIKVESELGKGSTFKVFLPLGKDHLLPEEITTIPISRNPMMDQSLEEEIPEAAIMEDEEKDLPMLLLIEDNQDLRIYIREILNSHYQIQEAIDGEEGVSKAIEIIPDVIISDLMMPKMDGLEVCKSLKEDYRTSHIPIILLTARSSQEDKIEGLKSLADEYLTKPFDKEELMVRLENLIAIRKKMQAYFSHGDLLKPKKLHLNSVDQIFIEKITEKLELEISNSMFSVEELAESVALSRSQLFRKIKAITNLSPNEFIRSFRLHRAMDMLQQKSATVAEVAYEVGFQNPSYFSKCFQKQFGLLPSEV